MKKPNASLGRPALWRLMPHALFALSLAGFVIWLLIAPDRLPPKFTHVPEASFTIGDHGSMKIKPVAVQPSANPAKTDDAKISENKPEGAVDAQDASAAQGAKDENLHDSTADKSVAAPGETSPATAIIKPNEQITADTAKLFNQLLQQDLQEMTPQGPLPHKSGDGRAPWQAYARPFPPQDQRPRVAIILTDIGYDLTKDRKLITELPRDVTLALNPYGADILPVSVQAKQLGFETLMQMNLDAGQGSDDGLGPLALRSDLDWATNQPRLYQTLGKTGGYVGVLAQQGSHFLRQEMAVQPLITELSQRGLLMVEPLVPDSVTALAVEQWQLPWARLTQTLDTVQDPDAVDLAMVDLLAKAKAQGRAIGIARATPMMQERLVAWQRRFAQEQVALAPVSAIVKIGAAGQSAPAALQPPTSTAPSPIVEDNPAIAPQAEALAPVSVINPAALPPPEVTPNAIVPGNHSAPAAPISITPNIIPAPAVPPVSIQPNAAPAESVNVIQPQAPAASSNPPVATTTPAPSAATQAPASGH